MDKLKPCPFCGGEAEIIVGHFWAWAKCCDCKTQTKAVGIVKNNEEKAKQEVAELWNRRVDNG